MPRVPIVKIENTLIATVQEGLRDRDALNLQTELGGMLERTGAEGVLIDISVVETMESFLGRMLNDIARQSQLLGAHTIVVGMQPAVAVTLVEMGLGLNSMRTALNVERGLQVLRQLAPDKRQIRGRRGR